MTRQANSPTHNNAFFRVRTNKHGRSNGTFKDCRFGKTKPFHHATIGQGTIRVPPIGSLVNAILPIASIKVIATFRVARDKRVAQIVVRRHYHGELIVGCIQAIGWINALCPARDKPKAIGCARYRDGIAIPQLGRATT